MRRRGRREPGRVTCQRGNTCSPLTQIYLHIVFSTKHHRHEPFQDEFRLLLNKYEVEYDERYVWD